MVSHRVLKKTRIRNNHSIIPVAKEVHSVATLLSFSLMLSRLNNNFDLTRISLLSLR